MSTTTFWVKIKPALKWGDDPIVSLHRTKPDPSKRERAKVIHVDIDPTATPPVVRSVVLTSPTAGFSS